MDGETNLNFQPIVREIDFQRYKTPPSSPNIQPAPVGATLDNLGNTCFMNAVLQCIIHTVPLVEKLIARNHPHACSDNRVEFCSFCALRSLAKESIRKSGLVVTPTSFVDNLRSISSNFQPGEQQDAHEFLTCLLESAHTSFLKPTYKDPQPLSDIEESPINQVFGGRLRSQLRCLDCGHSSNTYETMIDLSLEIDHVDNITSALESFTKVEKFEDPGTKFTCKGCEAQVSMVKQLKIEQPPNVIALHLKRFRSAGSSDFKITSFVEYPLELDLMPFISSPRENEQLIYELYAIVVHRGFCYSGHYYCSIRTSPDAWYQMNDSNINLISEINVLDQEAYILFYIKKGSYQWFMNFLESQKIYQLGMDRIDSASYALDLEGDDDHSFSASSILRGIDEDSSTNAFSFPEFGSLSNRHNSYLFGQNPLGFLENIATTIEEEVLNDSGRASYGSEGLPDLSP